MHASRPRNLSTQVRSWCAKAYENAVERGTLEQLFARVAARGSGRIPFKCAHCGKLCVPGEDGVAHHATKFCCKDHKRRWHREAAKDAA